MWFLELGGLKKSPKSGKRVWQFFHRGFWDVPLGVSKTPRQDLAIWPQLVPACSVIAIINAFTSIMIAMSFGNCDQHKIVFTHLDSESQSRMYSPPTTGVPPRALLIAVTCRRLDLICSRYWSWVLVLGIGGGYWVLVLGIGYWWWVCVQCTMYMNIARIANAAPCLFEESLWMLRLVRKRWHWNGRKRERGEEEGKETA